MTESTTEHDVAGEPVTLDKAGSDTAAKTAEGSGAGDAESTVDVTKPKRGRRARRAAAQAARAEQQGDADLAAGEAGDSTNVAAAKAGRSKRGASARAGTKAGAGSAAGRKGTADAAPAAAPVFGVRRVKRAIAALLVVVVLLAALVIVLAIKGKGNADKLEKQQDRQEAARQAADQVLPKLYSYDYRQIDANIAEQIQLTTASISDQIRTDTGPALKQLAPKTKAVVQAVSVGSAVVDGSTGDDVQVLVYLNQAVSSNLLPAPRLDRNRLVVTMRLVGGTWKVADIKAL